MTRSTTSEDSAFKHSSQPNWHSTSPARLMASQASKAEPRASSAVSAVSAPRTEPQRSPQPQGLSVNAHAWLARLPPRYQPLATARRHTHIINQLCEMWAQPQQTSVYLQDLMLSKRPRRDGFSFEVLTELADLQTLLGQDPHAPH
jgi:hypothetical protein